MKQFDDVRDAAFAVLADGPLPESELIDGLLNRLNSGRLGRDRQSRNEVTRLLRTLSDVVETDEGLTLVQFLVEGTSWAIFVDADDAAGTTGDGTRADGEPHGIEGGWLRIRNRLDPLSWWLVDDGAPLVDADGNQIGTLRTEGIWLDGIDTDVLWCGPGWLDEVAGGWANVAVRDGTISVAPLDEPPVATEEQIGAIRSGFEAAIAGDDRDDLWGEPPPDRRFAGTGSIVQEAIGLAGDVFRGSLIPPIPELLTAAGLVLDQGLVVEQGFDWTALRSWQQINRLTVSFGLNRDQARRAAEAGDVMHAALDGGGPVETHTDRIGELLVDSEVALAVLENAFQSGHSVAAVRQVLDRVASAAGNRGARTPIGVVWAQATCANAAGDAGTADQLVRTAVATGTTDRLMLIAAAESAADRGDAADAWRLLRQAGVEPYDPEADRFGEGPSEAQSLLDEVDHYAHPPRRREVGRNDTCPCGSGRKYKTCHQRDASFTLAERAPWLYGKALRFARSSLGDEIAEFAARIGGDDVDAVHALSDAPIVADMIMALDGAWDEFTEVRGSLLPDDEQMLATQWAMQQPSVFEVVEVERHRQPSETATLALRDIASGDRLRIESVYLGGQIQPGAVLFGRPLPLGETYRAFSGFLPVSRVRANDLIDAIADADVYLAAEILAAEFRPPHLQNSDGDDFELHEIEWKLDIDRSALAAALSEMGLEADPAEPTWHMVGEAGQGPNTVIAVLRIDDTTAPVSLTAEVNSRRRAERVFELLALLAPGVDPVRHDVTPIEEALADASERADFSDEPWPLPAGAAQAVAEMTARYEEGWIDEHIPALGGRTPREAVEDPVGREEVLQLLASFPEPDDDRVGAMNPARIRSLLGLE